LVLQSRTITAVCIFNIQTQTEEVMLPITSILWPTDGSDPALNALDAAIEFAQQFQVKLYALQVVHQVPTVTGSGFAPVAMKGFDVPLYEQELLNTAEKELHQMVEGRVAGDVEVESSVKIGIPADVIADFAQENDVGMIVMATHGRTGLSHFMLGSVAEKTVRLSTVPVLIIPEKSTER